MKFVKKQFLKLPFFRLPPITLNIHIMQFIIWIIIFGDIDDIQYLLEILIEEILFDTIYTKKNHYYLYNFIKYFIYSSLHFYDSYIAISFMLNHRKWYSNKTKEVIIKRKPKLTQMDVLYMLNYYELDLLIHNCVSY